MISKIGSLGNYGGPLLVDRVITNSVTLGISDSVRTVSGFAAAGIAAARVLGHVESFIGKDGLTPVKDGTLLQNLGATFAAAANNQTVAGIRVRVDVDGNCLYTADLSAAVGTTATAGGSGAAGKCFDLSNATTLAEATYLETTAQYYSHGINPAKPTQIVVNILESEVFGF